MNRRARPSFGYRAVHVIVSLDGINIEIQVRTLMQHVWADLMERLADRFGRQIRYGQPPVPPQGISQEHAEIIVNGMMGISDIWAANDPELPSEVGLDVNQITDTAWRGLSEAFRQAGIDL